MLEYALSILIHHGVTGEPSALLVQSSALQPMWAIVMLLAVLLVAFSSVQFHAHCLSETQYELAPATWMTGPRCANLTTCLSSQYQGTSATITSDRSCLELRRCRDDEYESTEPTATSNRACCIQITREGDVINDLELISALHTFTHMTGIFTLSMQNMTSLQWDIVAVGMYLQIVMNDALKHVQLPRLQHVRGSIDFLSNPTLTYIKIAQLRTVGRYLSVSGNTQLDQLDLPSLTYVGGGLFVHGNAHLTALSVPRLATVRSHFQICGNSEAFVLPLPLYDLWLRSTCMVNNGSAPCGRAYVACPA